MKSNFSVIFFFFKIKGLIFLHCPKPHNSQDWPWLHGWLHMHQAMSISCRHGLHKIRPNSNNPKKTKYMGLNAYKTNRAPRPIRSQQTKQNVKANRNKFYLYLQNLKSIRNKRKRHWGWNWKIIALVTPVSHFSLVFYVFFFFFGGGGRRGGFEHEKENTYLFSILAHT